MKFQHLKSTIPNKQNLNHWILMVSSKQNQNFQTLVKEYE
jgi:hypothetical protein